MSDSLIRPKAGPGGRVIWVSNDPALGGSDSNDGFTPAKCKSTVTGGAAAVRDRSNDILAFHRGDSYVGSFGSWRARGRSEIERLQITSWGPARAARPVIKTGKGNGLTFDYTFPDGQPHGHLWISGIHFDAHTNDGTSSQQGIWAVGVDLEDLVVDDCKIEHYETGIGSTWHHRRRKIRLTRSILVDQLTTSNQQGGTGFYFAGADDVVVDECLFHKNGAVQPNQMKHQGYFVSGCTGCVVRRSVFAECGAQSLDMRAGGLVEDCLFSREPIALNVGVSPIPEAAGVDATVRRVVILEGGNIDAGNKRGWGVWVNNIRKATMEDVIVANCQPGTQGRPFIVTSDWHHDPGFADIGVQDLSLRGLVLHNWGSGMELGGPGARYGRVALESSDIGRVGIGECMTGDDGATLGKVQSKGNRFGPAGGVPHFWFGGGKSLTEWKAATGDTTSSVLPTTPYQDPSRTLARYDKEMLGGPGTHDHFFSEARAHWGKPELSAQTVNAWVAAGFGKQW